LPTNVLLSAMGHQARQAHQEDVPTSCIDTQNIYLCRVPLARADERMLALGGVAVYSGAGSP
jgi:hypothetical protein